MTAAAASPAAQLRLAIRPRLVPADSESGGLKAALKATPSLPVFLTVVGVVCGSRIMSEWDCPPRVRPT